MCPPSSPTPLGDIGLCCTDKDVVLSLDKLIRGSPLPGDVLDYLNPYQNQPQHLPDDIWYLVNSNGPKESEYGFWNKKGDARQIFENSVLQGWKNTLEFFEGHAPYGRKTEWVMQEYSITRKGLQKDIQKKKSSTVSTRLPEVHKTENIRDFLELNDVDEDTRDFLELNDLVGDARQSPEVYRVADASDEDILGGDYLELNDLNRDIRKSPVVGKPESPVDEDLADAITRGDYLELNDLASHSSSSANSSHRKSDDFFALLRDLDDEKSQDLRANNSGYHCNFMLSVTPNEVILPPATSELLFRGTGVSEPRAEAQPTSSTKAKSSDKASKDPNAKRPKPEYRNEGSSNGSSSKRSKKKFKKYFCFLPF